MMDLGLQSPALGCGFGLPYVLVRTPRPYDTTTLNYNWQVWNAKAFSVYTTATYSIDEQSAWESVEAVLRFLSAQHLLSDMHFDEPKPCRIVTESSLVSVHTHSAGIYRRFYHPGDHVRTGQALCEILHPLEGTVLDRVCSPVNGRVFFAHKSPLGYERGVIYKIIVDA